MSVGRHRAGWVNTAAMSWRTLSDNLSFAVFSLLSLFLLIFSSSQPVAVEKFRMALVDRLAPAMDVLGRPVAAAENAVRSVSEYVHIKQENERLRQENARLAQWQNAAVVMEKENRELRGLLNYKPEPQFSFVSARIIADTGGPFMRNVVITAGKLDGAREGMAAIASGALIGRIVESGDWSSRIMLITDINSRIPVSVTGSGDNAILAGDGASGLKLLYLPQNAEIKAGDRIVTSGHGGVFPPNIPVGTVVADKDGMGYSVVPLAGLSRVNQVRLVDFHLAGGQLNPMTSAMRRGADWQN